MNRAKFQPGDHVEIITIQYRWQGQVYAKQLEPHKGNKGTITKVRKRERGGPGWDYVVEWDVDTPYPEKANNIDEECLDHVWAPIQEEDLAYVRQSIVSAASQDQGPTLQEIILDVMETHHGSATNFCVGCDWIPDDPKRDERLNEREHVADMIARTLQTEHSAWIPGPPLFGGGR